MKYQDFLKWAMSNLGVVKTVYGEIMSLISSESLEEKWQIIKNIGDAIVPALGTLTFSSSGMTASQIAGLEGDLLQALNTTEEGAAASGIWTTVALQVLFGVVRLIMNK